MRTKLSEIKQDSQTIVYLIYDSIRFENNHTLFEAMALAEEYQKELEIVFPVDFFSHMSKRQMNFIKQGLNDMQEALLPYYLKVQWVLDTRAYLTSKSIVTIVLDYPYTVKYRESIIKYLKDYSLTYVEGNVLVPVAKTYPKEAYSALSIRKKIHQLIPLYEADFNETMYLRLLNSQPIQSFEPLNLLVEDGNYHGGEKEAKAMFQAFIKSQLKDYDDAHSFPERNCTSKMSLYLNYGMISIQYLYQQLKPFSQINQGYIEELIVRRELAYNFCFYNPHHDQLSNLHLGEWAYQAMRDHLMDERIYLYQKEDYLNLKTHDLYFNACMSQLIETGYMHGYMRMYWGKKIIEWSKTYDEAYLIMLSLNNELSLDGYNPNSYTGVAWCFGKHDRPFFNRPIFGQIRYMNDKGLERKFDIKKYVAQWLK